MAGGCYSGVRRGGRAGGGAEDNTSERWGGGRRTERTPGQGFFCLEIWNDATQTASASTPTPHGSGQLTSLGGCPVRSTPSYCLLPPPAAWVNGDAMPPAACWMIDDDSLSDRDRRRPMGDSDADATVRMLPACVHAAATILVHALPPFITGNSCSCSMVIFGWGGNGCPQGRNSQTHGFFLYQGTGMGQFLDPWVY
jgi:hypothetical protein